MRWLLAPASLVFFSGSATMAPLNERHREGFRVSYVKEGTQNELVVSRHCRCI